MVKKSILKSAFREISTNKKRFISTMLIIALGVGFFVGLKSTPLDMMKTAKNYYKTTNLMDLKIVSNYGFSKSEVDLFKNIKEVKGIMLVKTLDTMASVKDKDFVIKVHGINKDRSIKNDDYINRPILTSGRYPSTINEGLVEEKFLKDNNLKLGDLVTLKPEDQTALRAKRIKIVGTIKESYYSSNDRGTTNLSDGKIDYYMYIEENDFSTNYYTEGYITFKNSDNYDTYSKEYKSYIDKNKEEILKIASSSTNEKYQNNLSELKGNINSLEQSLNELYQSQIPTEILNDSIKELSDSLNNAKETLKTLPLANAYVLSRNEIPSFYEYKLETERIQNISKIFPLIFFLVAALVSLTAMTRIVDEEKIEIGTLRAIGYSKFDVLFKYVFCSLLISIIGSVLGTVLFYKLIPIIIATCYGSFYEMPSLITTFQINHVMFASIYACLTTLLATILVFIKNINQTPASLIRPIAPKQGKRIWLEKINMIWKKLSFSNKVTFRNVFRYKKRLLMTVIGICGCTSLLLTSFGLNDTVNKIVSKQFENINKYDMAVSIKQGINGKDLAKLKEDVTKNKGVNKIIMVNQSFVNIKNKNTIEKASMIIPEDKNKINDFIVLKQRTEKKKKIVLDDDGIVISEKLSKLLDVKKGDKVKININSVDHKVKIGDITENYIDHYIYISPKGYEKITGNKNSYNLLLTDNNKNVKENEISKKVMENKYVLSCNFLKETKDTYQKKLSTLNYVTLILIASAASLAFVVLYNLSNINISERKRELSTLKVLGFYDYEVTNYVHKETIILTVIGGIMGLLFGSLLTYYVIKSCETNMFMFSFNIKFTSYVLSFLMTMVFLIIVNIIMHFDLKKLDFIKALNNFE